MANMNPFIPFGEFETGHIPHWHAALHSRIERIISGYPADMASQAKEAMDAHVAFIQADSDLGKAIEDQRAIANGNKTLDPELSERAGNAADALDHMRLAEASYFENQLQSAAVLDIHRFREELRNEIRTDAAKSKILFASEAYAFVIHPGFEPSHEATDVPEQYDAISRNLDAFLQDNPEILQAVDAVQNDIADAPIAESGDIEPIADINYDDMQPDSYRPLDTSRFYEEAGRTEEAELARQDFEARAEADREMSKLIHRTRKTNPEAADALVLLQQSQRGGTDANAGHRAGEDGIELDGPTYKALSKGMDQADDADFKIRLLAGNERATELHAELLRAEPVAAAPAQQAQPTRRRRVAEGDKQPHFFVNEQVETPATVEATSIDTKAADKAEIDRQDRERAAEIRAAMKEPAEAYDEPDAESPFNDEAEDAEYQQEKQDRENSRKAEAADREAFDGKLNALIEVTRETDPEVAEALEIVGEWEDSSRRAFDEGRRVSYQELDRGDPDRMRVDSIHDDADKHGEEFDAHPARDRAHALLETTFSKEEIAFVAEKADASKEADAQAPESSEKTRERRRPLPSEGYKEWMNQEPPAAQKPQTPKEITDAFIEKIEQRRKDGMAELEKFDPEGFKKYQKHQERMKLDPQELALVGDADKTVAGDAEAGSETVADTAPKADQPQGRMDLAPDEQATLAAAKKTGDGKSDTDKQPIIVDVAGIQKDDGKSDAKDDAKDDGKGEKASSGDNRLELTTPEKALVNAAIAPLVKSDKEGHTQK